MKIGEEGGSRQRFGERILLVLLLLLTAVVVAFGAVSFARKIQTFQPLGLAAVERGSSLVISEAPSDSALRVGDQLVLVNGEQVIDRGELRGQLRRRETSEIIALRGDEMVRVSHTLPPLDLDLSYLLLVLIGVVHLFVGLYTLLRGLSRQTVLFHLWCLASTGVYLLSAVVPTEGRLDRLIYLLDETCRLLVPPLMLNFFLLFPRAALANTPRLRLAHVVPFLYLPAAAVLAIQLDSILANGAWFAGPNTPARVALLDQIGLALIVVFAFLSAALVVLHLQRAKRWEEGRQLLWIALGMAAGYLPFLLLYVVPRGFHVEVPEVLQVLAVLPLSLVPLSFAYAILRYRLWDIAIIVRDVVTYTVTILLGALGFSLVNLLIRRSIPEDFELTRNLTTIAGGLLIAGMLIPTKQGIGATLQRFHYRGSFGRRRALSQFGHELLHERDLEHLSNGLLQELEECMDLDGCNLYLVEGRQLAPVRETSPSLEAAMELSLSDLDPELWKKDFVVFSGPTLPETELRSDHMLYLQGYRCAFPLLVRERRVGLVLAGHKQGQVPLNSDDALLIRQLLNQAALAIENAQLLEQMQRQLQEVIELKQFNEEIIESSPAGIAVLDHDGRVVLANLAFAALAGFERSAMRRRPIEEVLPVEMPPTDGGLIETSYVDSRGRERNLQLSHASFLGDPRRRMRVLVVNDVTDLAAMEKALEEKERLAALGMMAAGVAHEVNTPLTGISSYAQMLLANTPAEDPRHELLRKVERQTFRAAKIVNNLLELARNSRPDNEPVDLVSVLEDCVDLLAPRLKEQGIEIRWPERRPAELRVDGNEGELHQVFSNLLTNALEAHGESDDRWISFELEGDEDRVGVHVTDHGSGVAPEHLGQIFQPFFSTKLDSGGTGLGLSISYEIVRRHGGELQATNEPDGGCRFKVLLPRRREPSTRGSP